MNALLGDEQHFVPPASVPILAIYANPHASQPGEPADPTFDAFVTGQIAALQRAMPSAQVVVLPNADHFVYNSNNAEVLNYINTFISKLPT